MIQSVPYMRISELARRAAVPPSTIRFYVREGLLPPPVRPGKTRAYYTAEHESRIGLIKRMRQEQGMTLAEIREALPPQAVKEGSTHEGMAPPARRDDIIESAITLFRSKGYDATSIADIVGHACIGKGTFYLNFRNKEELFLECADRVFRDIGTEFREIREEPDALRKLKARSVLFVRSQQHIMDMLNLARGRSVGDNPAFKRKLDEILKNLVEPVARDLADAKAQRRLGEYDTAMLAALLLGAAEYLIYYFKYHPEEDQEKHIEPCWSFIMRGAALKDTTVTAPRGEDD